MPAVAWLAFSSRDRSSLPSGRGWHQRPGHLSLSCTTFGCASRARREPWPVRRPKRRNRARPSPLLAARHRGCAARCRSAASQPPCRTGTVTSPLLDITRHPTVRTLPMRAPRCFATVSRFCSPSATGSGSSLRRSDMLRPRAPGAGVRPEVSRAMAGQVAGLLRAGGPAGGAARAPAGCGRGSGRCACRHDMGQSRQPRRVIDSLEAPRVNS